MNAEELSNHIINEAHAMAEHIRKTRTVEAPNGNAAGDGSLDPLDGLLALGTETPYGKIGAVTNKGGERYYFCVHEDKTVSLMPAFMVEKQPIDGGERPL